MKHTLNILTLTALLLATFPVRGSRLADAARLARGQSRRRNRTTHCHHRHQQPAEARRGRRFPASRSQEEPRTGKFIGLGMMLDSAVKFAAHTGDAKVIALKKHLVAEIIEAQESRRLHRDVRAGTNASRHSGTCTRWATSSGRCSKTTGISAKRRRWPPRARPPITSSRTGRCLPPDWGRDADVAPHVAFTGLERTMLALHRATGEPAYLRFVTQTRALPEWDLGIVIGRRPGIEGHVYAYMARCLAQLELHRLQPAARLLRPTRARRWIS